MKKGVEKRYLPEFVYGSIDGTITTFAIVAGSFGASLNSAIILILGFANLFADGFSMAVSNYLSTKSQKDLDIKDKREQKNPIETAIATFIAFVVIGFIPLISFVLALFIPALNSNKFLFSIALTGLAFVIIGAIKGDITEKSKFKSALETLIIGGMAALIAFIVGYLLKGIAG